MSLKNSPHKDELREAGWHSRGYLPHFDGRDVPQFITSHLFDSVPGSVLERWKRELNVSNSRADQIRSEERRVGKECKYQGGAFLKNEEGATMIEDLRIGEDNDSERLSSR